MRRADPDGGDAAAAFRNTDADIQNTDPAGHSAAGTVMMPVLSSAIRKLPFAARMLALAVRILVFAMRMLALAARMLALAARSLAVAVRIRLPGMQG